MTNEHEILTIDELSRYLSVPKSTLYRLSASGGLPCHKVGRHWRFRREAVDRWLDHQAGPPGRQEDGKSC